MALVTGTHGIGVKTPMPRQWRKRPSVGDRRTHAKGGMFVIGIQSAIVAAGERPWSCWSAIRQGGRRHANEHIITAPQLRVEA